MECQMESFSYDEIFVCQSSASFFYSSFLFSENEFMEWIAFLRNIKEYLQELKRREFDG